MEAEWVAIDEVTPWDENPRINDGAVKTVADSITRFGWGSPILCRGDGVVIAGHTRLKAAQELGLDKVLVRYMDLDPATAKALALADNKLGEIAEWDDGALAQILIDLDSQDLDLSGLGWSEEELDAILDPPDERGEYQGDSDVIPEIQPAVISKVGEVYLLGPHRLMCGDSTDPEMVKTLMGGDIAELLHADPPYGMGKESDGVLNDNLYRENLDQFQMDWISLWLKHSTDRASLYIWGNAEGLWRLWYKKGLNGFDSLTFRNEIVWDKSFAFGMSSSLNQMYPVGTERCFHIMRGDLFKGNNNKDQYWEGYEPIRLYMRREQSKEGWSSEDVHEITGNHMLRHWVAKSQFSVITEQNYNKLKEAAKNAAFPLSYDEFISKFKDIIKAGKLHAKSLTEQIQAKRSYFDNTHDNMYDVWKFSRVTGDDRHGHATPKPVDMIARICKTSAPEGGWVAEPFGGSGSTLISAAMTGRKCATMELDPAYCDVIRRRWPRWAVANNQDPGPGALNE